MLKTPQNHSAPPYIQEKTDKRVSSFLLEYYKNLIHVYGRENMVCLELQREGDVTLHHIGLRGQKFPQGQKNGTFWEQGNTMEQDMLMSEWCWVMSLGSLFVTWSAGHAWDCVF